MNERENVPVFHQSLQGSDGGPMKFMRMTAPVESCPVCGPVYHGQLGIVIESPGARIETIACVRCDYLETREVRPLPRPAAR